MGGQATCPEFGRNLTTELTPHLNNWLPRYELRFKGRKEQCHGEAKDFCWLVGPSIVRFT